MAYGACADVGAEYASRITVVVAPDGKVAKVYDSVAPKTHPDEVLAAIVAGL